jgi:FtsZ-binding cell division protein ZapB
MSEKVVDWGKQTQTEEIEKAIGQLESWRADYAALRKEVPRLRAKNAGLSQNFTKVHYENAELLKENKKLKSCLVAAQQIYKEISNTLTQNFD